MINWEDLTLYIYVMARVSGMILFSPIFSRTNIPGFFRGGMILVFTAVVGGVAAGPVYQPLGLVDFGIHIVYELAIGFFLSLVMQFFFYVVQLAGHTVDTQMGMTMNQIYDASARANLSVTSQILNILMMLLFFAQNGHYTLLNIMLSSHRLIAFGAGRISTAALESLLLIFSQCTLLGVKLCMPILAAELLGQVSMGILMKVNPQINVFTINIDLKVIIGMTLLMILMAPFSEFLLGMEADMLKSMQDFLGIYL